MALSVLPPFVWASLDVFRDEFLWLYPVAAPLAVAAHLANVLPDLETDAAAGRRSLAVVLGRDGSLRLLAGCLVAPLAVLALSLLWLAYETSLLLPGLVVYLLLASAALVLLRRGSGRRGAVGAFRIVVLASVLFAAGWLAAV